MAAEIQPTLRECANDVLRVYKGDGLDANNTLMKVLKIQFRTLEYARCFFTEFSQDLRGLFDRALINMKDKSIEFFVKRTRQNENFKELERRILEMLPNKCFKSFSKVCVYDFIDLSERVEHIPFCGRASQISDAPSSNT